MTTTMTMMMVVMIGTMIDDDNADIVTGPAMFLVFLPRMITVMMIMPRSSVLLRHSLFCY